MREGAGDAVEQPVAGATGEAGRGPLRVGECLVHPDLDRILGPHGEAALEPKAMAVLVHLAGRAGEVVSTAELIEAVWLGRPMGDNPVYRCIAALRRAFGDDPRAPRYIATVPTKGYRLIAPVARAAPALPDPPSAPSPEHAPPQRSRRWRERWLPASLLLVAIALAGSAWLAWPTRHAGSSAVTSPSATVPVTVAMATSLPAPADEAGDAWALLRDDLARVRGVRVVNVSPAGSTLPPPRWRVAARWQRTDGAARWAVELIDLREDGRTRWSSGWRVPGVALQGTREAVVAGLAAALGQPVPVLAPVDATAWSLYRQGLRELAQAPERPGEALERFRRVTILAPGFARGYLGMARALAQQADNDPGPAVAARAQAMQALQRAQALDPSLGEAWAVEATLTADPVRAEALFRRGLALAPSDADGEVDYARFLFAHGRVGEAIAAMQRARRLDPADPQLCLTEAFFVMVVSSDVDAHDRLVRQALAIAPRLPAALYQLAYAQWEYRGELAEAARLTDRLLAVDPDAARARALARDIALDLGDDAAAVAVLGAHPPATALGPVWQYRGRPDAAATALQPVTPAAWPDRGPQAAAAQAVRDAAIARGRPADALAQLDAVHTAHAGQTPMWFRGFDVVRAHALVLAGRVAEGRALAQRVQAMVAAHDVGRAHPWFTRERSAAAAVLGDRAGALAWLARAVAQGQTYRWWYLAGHDPLYQPLRDDPAFQALDRRVRAAQGQQRARLDAMRRQPGYPW